MSFSGNIRESETSASSVDCREDKMVILVVAKTTSQVKIKMVQHLLDLSCSRLADNGSRKLVLLQA